MEKCQRSKRGGASEAGSSEAEQARRSKETPGVLAGGGADGVGGVGRGVRTVCDVLQAGAELGGSDVRSTP